MLFCFRHSIKTRQLGGNITWAFLLELPQLPEFQLKLPLSCSDFSQKNGGKAYRGVTFSLYSFFTIKIQPNKLSKLRFCVEFWHFPSRLYLVSYETFSTFLATNSSRRLRYKLFVSFHRLCVNGKTWYLQRVEQLKIQNFN